MLEAIAAGPPPGWDHADAWARRMRRWARACRRLIVPTGSDVERATVLLDVDPAAFSVVPNGFDPQRFRPFAVDRAAFWQRHLAVAALDDAVVLLARDRLT